MEELLGAIARGYCTKENEGKLLDAELCKAIANEVYPLFTETRKNWVEEEMVYWVNELQLSVQRLAERPDSGIYKGSQLVIEEQITRLEAALKALSK